MDIDQFIKEAQARCNAATKGPWRLQTYSNYGDAVIYAEKCGCVAERWDGNGAPSERTKATRANFDFIAHARQDLPAALEIIVAVRAQLATVTQERDNAASNANYAVKRMRELDEEWLIRQAKTVEKETAALRARVAELEAARIKRIVADFASRMQCACDLDNWEPEPVYGHSHVCPIYKAALEAVRGMK